MLQLQLWFSYSIKGVNSWLSNHIPYKQAIQCYLCLSHLKEIIFMNRVLWVDGCLCVVESNCLLLYEADVTHWMFIFKYEDRQHRSASKTNRQPSSLKVGNKLLVATNIDQITRHSTIGIVYNRPWLRINCWYSQIVVPLLICNFLLHQSRNGGLPSRTHVCDNEYCVCNPPLITTECTENKTEAWI